MVFNNMPYSMDTAVNCTAAEVCLFGQYPVFRYSYYLADKLLYTLVFSGGNRYNRNAKPVPTPATDRT